MEDRDRHRVSDCLAQLNAAVNQLTANMSTWQCRIEGKMDQQLCLLLGSATSVAPRSYHGQSRSCASPVASPKRNDADLLGWSPPGAAAGDGDGALPVEEGYLSEDPALSRKHSRLEFDVHRGDTRELSNANKSFIESATGLSKAESKGESRVASGLRSSVENLMRSKKMAQGNNLKKVDNFITQARREEAKNSLPPLLKLTADKRYEMGVMIIIVLNSICIGWQVQVVAYRVEDAFTTGSAYDTSPPIIFFMIQAFFAIVLLVELMLRWIAEGFLEFFTSRDVLWNIFDIFTVLVGMVELVLELAEPDSAIVASISLIRVLKILRIVRVLKLIRTYHFFHELRLMFESCLNSFKSYMWSILVLLLVIFLFAIFLTTGVCSFLSSEKKYLAVDGRQVQSLQYFFGTVDRSMLALFQTIAGGRDWYEIYDALGILGSEKRIVYLIYISFATYAVCNVVASVFVESALQSATHDREFLIREQLRDASVSLEKMLSVFMEMDSDGTGTISEDEFLDHLDDDRVVAYFNSMKLDVSDATSLFHLLDVDHSGSVEINEFIEGCQRLKGESRSLDMHLMRYELSSMRFELHDLALKFYKFADVQGVKHLADEVLAEHSHVQSGLKSCRPPHPTSPPASPGRLLGEAATTQGKYEVYNLG